MSKTNEELNELKKEVEAGNEKLQELTPEEITQVNGGTGFIYMAPRLAKPVFETAREDYVR